jgi:hypothetical protein
MSWSSRVTHGTGVISPFKGVMTKVGTSSKHKPSTLYSINTINLLPEII